MLVLTRKPDEKIIIGKDKNKKITITILKVHGDKVSIGIEADKDTPIYRDELLHRDVEKCNKKSLVEADSREIRQAVQELQKELKKNEENAEALVP
jgi:carbon storage regulator